MRPCFTSASDLGPTWDLKAPIAWIEAGIHAKEWIASATATFINNYGDNPEIVDNLNIYILPMANPDGYEYS